MGGVISSAADLAENQWIKKFTGLQPVSDNDPFWNQLFSYNYSVDEANPETVREFEQAAEDALQALMYNTQTTGNFGALIRVFLRRALELNASEVCDNKIFLWQMANALIIIRYVCRSLTQRLSESGFLNAFNSKEFPSNSKVEHPAEDLSDENPVRQFYDVLLSTITMLPVNEHTTPVHMESVRCVLVIFGRQLYSENISNTHSFFLYLQGKGQQAAADLTKALLTNYLMYSSSLPSSRKLEPESIVISLATSMWSMLQTATGYGSLNEEGDGTQMAPSTLGSISCLLLLTLTCHPNTHDGQNYVKESLAAFQNAQEISACASDSFCFTVDYSVLYDRLCATVRQQPPMLLLYVLLHRNSGFRNYILSRINLENLVVPVMMVLNSGPGAAGSTSHHLYLSLIVLLILSEDDFFCKVVHETMVTRTEWFNAERPLGEISLGGLITLVVAKTIQTNTIKTRDRYLHTNCLAALANMSSSFKELSPNVCQKLIGLLEIMTKRHAKLIEHMRASAEVEMSEMQNSNYHQDITALEEGIRTVLEMCNSCLSNNLRNNPNLIYTILYKRELFETFHNHPMFQDLIWNISAVINHFAARVQPVANGSVTEVLDVISKAAIQWPTDRLKKFPDLKFKYVEDENTVEFFVPYVWRLVIAEAGIYWDPQTIKLVGN
uniref:Dymeclin n=1 Tax=Steinernema glaseri TaxID=37863 RepID=A0A1I8A383_9BILA